jgi:cytochrome P450
LPIVGGNDTTRNSMSGGVGFLTENPGEYDKLRNNLDLIPNMVSEIISYQTPLPHMFRTALEDIELSGKQMKKSDNVIRCYTSGNRDETVLDRPPDFIIDRPKARHPLSFGCGIHRCMGNGVAELELRVMCEKIMKRFSSVEVFGENKRLPSNFVQGVTEMPVILHK